MKIEKKKISTDSKWNISAKKGMAALMGLTAVSSLTACLEVENSPMAPQNPTEVQPSSSESSIPVQPVSSSSQVVVDIPKSSAHVDVDQLSSPSGIDSLIVAGMVITDVTEDTTVVDSLHRENSSSSEVLSSSSIEIIEPVAGVPLQVPDDHKQESSSSSVESSSSEKTDFCDLNPQSPLCPCDSNVQICPDPEDPENMIVSMVTTFERTDIDV